MKIPSGTVYSRMVSGRPHPVRHRQDTNTFTSVYAEMTSGPDGYEQLQQQKQSPFVLPPDTADPIYHRTPELQPGQSVFVMPVNTRDPIYHKDCRVTSAMESPFYMPTGQFLDKRA